MVALAYRGKAVNGGVVGNEGAKCRRRRRLITGENGILGESEGDERRR